MLSRLLSPVPASIHVIRIEAWEPGRAMLLILLAGETKKRASQLVAARLEATRQVSSRVQPMTDEHGSIVCLSNGVANLTRRESESSGTALWRQHPMAGKAKKGIQDEGIQ